MKSFKVPIFGCKIHLYDDMEKAEEYVANYGSLGSSHEYSAWVVALGSHIVMAFDKEQLSAGVIAHESYHAARAVLRHCEIKVHKKDEELTAYLVEYIANQCAARLS